MIADLIDSKYNLRFITRNVMSVYSTNSEYTDYIIRKLKHSNYTVNHKTVSSDDIIAYTRRSYNPYEIVYKYALRNKDIDVSKLIRYLSFVDLDYLLWCKFIHIDSSTKSLLESIFLLATNKQIVIIDYIDDFPFREKLYTLAFHVGLEDRLIIIPFRNIKDAVNNSTCQCYVKNTSAVKIQSDFSNSFLNSEFGTSLEYYNRKRPAIYRNNRALLVPTSIKYSFYDLWLIFLFNVKYFIISLYLWGSKLCL